MTEKEALDNPEMKTLLLLSGYVLELKEGKDYIETTYKLAETISKMFAAHHAKKVVCNCHVLHQS